MKKVLAVSFLLLSGSFVFAQNNDRDKITFKESQPGYYQNTIMKDINESPLKAKPKENGKSVKADVSGKNFPTDPDQYTQQWHNKPISQS